jgi:hypothetical protein
MTDASEELSSLIMQQQAIATLLLHTLTETKTACNLVSRCYAKQLDKQTAAAAGGRGRRGRRTLESTSGTSKLTLGNRRLLLGLPKDDWTRPPSYVGKLYIYALLDISSCSYRRVLQLARTVTLRQFVH